MVKKNCVFRLSAIVIIALFLILIGINVLYIKEACSTRQCLVVNVSTIALLIWVALFWYMILKHSRRG